MRDWSLSELKSDVMTTGDCIKTNIQVLNGNI